MNELAKAFGAGGNMLSGMGAGLAGNGDAWQRNQLMAEDQNQSRQRLAMQDRQQTEEFKKERSKSLFYDASAMRQLGKQGKWNEVAKISANRMEAAKSIPGVDFTESQIMMDLAGLAASGDQEARTRLGSMLDSAHTVGVEYGILDRESSEPERIKKGDLINGFVYEVQSDGTINGRRVLTDEQIAAGQSSESNKGSAKTETYANGTVVMAMPEGAPKVWAPNGERAFGADAVKVIAKANEHAVKQSGLSAGAAAAATQAIKISGESYTKLEAMRPAIANLDTAIRELRNGAGSGYLESKLPAFTASTKALRNVAKRMGLDVVAQGSFGPLNASELDIAMAVALPSDMDEPQLLQWVIDRKAAQTKMIDYLQDTAIYLGTPEHNVAGWLNLNKQAAEKNDPQPAGGQGWSPEDEARLQQLEAQEANR
jgi:hypothetical protein